MYIRKYLTILGLLLSISLIGQEAGATIYGGLINAKLHSQNYCLNCKYQSGYVVGLDGRLNSGALYFMVSGDYGKLDLLPVETVDYIGKDKMTLFKLKAGMGFKILGFSDRVYLSSKIQMSFTNIFKYDDTILKLSNYRLNDGFLGATTGLMLNYGVLIIELEFERGLLNMFYDEPETKLNFLTLKTGFKF
jgi:hypothetical protein